MFYRKRPSVYWGAIATSVISLLLPSPQALSKSASVPASAVNGDVQAQINPPAIPAIGEPRPIEEPTSPPAPATPSQSICRDLESFYILRGAPARANSDRLETELAELQRQKTRHEQLERDIRIEQDRLASAQQTLQRYPSDASAQQLVDQAEARLNELIAEQTALGYDQRRYQAVLAQVNEADKKEQDENLSRWNENALSAIREGRLEDAADLFRRIERRASDLDLFDDLVAAQTNLAVIQEVQGNYREALEQYQQILDAEEEDGRLRQQVTSLINIARVYTQLGSYNTALDYYDRALSSSQQNGFHYAESTALSSKGFLNNQQGNYRAALATLEQALAKQQTLGAGGRQFLDPKYGILQQPEIILSGIGLAHAQLGQYEQALVAYEQAFTDSQTCDNKAGRALSLNGLGDVALHREDITTALEYYQQSLMLRRELGDRTGLAESYADIARLYQIQGEPELAIVFYKQAVTFLEDIRQNIEPLPPEQQRDYTDSVTAVYEQLAGLLLEQNRTLEGQQILDLLRLQELNEYLKDVSRGQRDLDFWPAEASLLAQFETAVTQEQPLSTFPQNPRVQTLIEQLRRDARGQQVNPSLLQGLQDDVRRMDEKGALLYPLILRDRLELILIPPTGDLIQETVEVTEAELQQGIQAFRRDLSVHNTDPTPEAHQLYEWLIKPLEESLAAHDIETLIYVPDGQLRYVPLAAFHDGNHWLIQRFRINHITAASVTDWATSDQQASPSILAAAYGQNRNDTITAGEEFKFFGLPNADIEVRTISTLIPDTTTLLDEAFTRSAVESRLDGRTVVHFATHGKFVEGDPEESFLLFGDGDHITVREIGDWPLSAAELIVFSACETALGDELSTGEEVLGLGYQVQRAGARAAIASLWLVSDPATSALMTQFYLARAQKNVARLEALRQAQLHIAAQDAQFTGDQLGTRGGIGVVPLEVEEARNFIRTGHPYYWAPFILIGNGF